MYVDDKEQFHHKIVIAIWKWQFTADMSSQWTSANIVPLHELIIGGIQYVIVGQRWEL